MVRCTISAAAAAKSLQSCPTLCDPIDGSPPGSTIPGILQAWENKKCVWLSIARCPSPRLPATSLGSALDGSNCPDFLSLCTVPPSQEATLSLALIGWELPLSPGRQGQTQVQCSVETHPHPQISAALRWTLERGEGSAALVRRQGSQVSTRVARGSASWLSSHGRGLGPRDAH